MSDLSLNSTASPELLNAALANGPGPARSTGATDRPRAPAEHGPDAPNPFAALLSGVLGGTQPAPTATAAAAPGSSLTDPLPAADDGSSATSLLALPGTAAPLPVLDDAATGLGGVAAGGNPLPATGNSLPVDLAAQGTGLKAPATVVGTDTATDSTPPNSGATRPRTSLADLALSRPLEPAPGLPAASADDAARSAAAVALAGRAVATASRVPEDKLPASAEMFRLSGRAPDPDGRSTAAATTTAMATGTTLLPYGTPAPDAANAAAAGDLSLRLAMGDLARSTGIPGIGTGTEFLAGQFAAFAATTDGSPGIASSPSTGTAATTDAGSAALLGRLGSTTLPPLQPLGDPGAFAGGLADRLVTLGGPGMHSARLRLHPENLGELDVEITMDDGTAQVWFGTTTSQARDAIEASLPRLRELFADQGIQLTRTQIDSGGGHMSNSGSGQERRMTGGAGAWNDVPAWQHGRTVGGAEPAGRAAASASARLLDVWA